MTAREWRWQFGNTRREAPPGASGPVLDMTPDGQFAGPPQPTLSTRLLGIAVLVAVVAGLIGIAALAFYVAMLLIPVAILAALIAYAAFRFKLWRARQGSGGWSVRRY